MAESHVLCALKRRYAQALGMTRLEGAQAETDAAHLAAVIRMFNADEDLTVIRPIRPYKEGRERWHRTVWRILKEADGPLRAREMARLVMDAHGIDRGDHKRLLSISCGLQSVLGKLVAKGIVMVDGKPRRWSLAG